jgi:hypothetical protein
MQWQGTLLQVTAAVVREAISDAIARNARRDYEKHTQREKPAEDEGCPYCQCADYLASAALLYYDAAQDEKLVQVAQAKIQEAHEALMKREVLLNPKGVELIAQVAALEDLRGDPKEMAKRCLEARRMAMALAGAKMGTSQGPEEGQEETSG